MFNPRRRQFITLLGGAAVTWPLAARAQQSGKLPTIGFVGSNASAWGAWTTAFVARLHDLGWIEGRTLGIEYRWSEGRPERIAEIAAEFVKRNVDVIVTNDSSAQAIKRATSDIPIVFVLGNDPIGDSSPIWRGRAAMSPACRCSRRKPTVSGSNFCARLSPGFVGWQL